MFSLEEKKILRKILFQDPGMDNESVELLYRDLLARDFAAPKPDETRKSGRRWDHEVIESFVPSESSVLDLGCGDGELLQILHEKKGCDVQGVEREFDPMLDCLQRGVPVIQADIDKGLKFIKTGLYDYVILEKTLQTVHRPMMVLNEMLRVGKVGIVSFPNFGYWRVRMQLLVEGVMPASPELPHEWHETPNIHLLTIRDFENVAKKNGLFVSARYAYAEGKHRPLIPEDNLLAEQALYVLSSKNASGV